MEHGAVVIAYNCPEGCASEVQAAKEVMAAAPAKPGCPRAPVILTPDPTLDVRFAAAAWGHVLRASCFDRQAFGDFIAERRDMGPEKIPGDCGVRRPRGHRLVSALTKNGRADTPRRPQTVQPAAAAPV